MNIKNSITKVLRLAKEHKIFIAVYISLLVAICIGVNLYTNYELDKSEEKINKTIELVFGNKNGVCYRETSTYTLVSYQSEEKPSLEKDSSIYSQMYGDVNSYFVAKNKPWNIKQYVFEDGLLKKYIINPCAVGMKNTFETPEGDFKILYDDIIEGYDVSSDKIIEPSEIKTDYHYIQEYHSNLGIDTLWYNYYSDKLFYTKNCCAYYRVTENEDRVIFFQYTTLACLILGETLVFFLFWLLNDKIKRPRFSFFKRVGGTQSSEEDTSENISPQLQNDVVTDIEYDVLLHKINPINFMNPYDSDKVKIANDLYSALLNSRDNTTIIHLIEEKAKSDLGI